MTYLLKNFNFATLKFMKTCSVKRFCGPFFCPGIRLFWRNFAWPRFCTPGTSVPTFTKESTNNQTDGQQSLEWVG